MTWNDRNLLTLGHANNPVRIIPTFQYNQWGCRFKINLWNWTPTVVFRNHDITVLLKRNDVFYNRPVIVKPKFECEKVSNMDHVHFQTLVVWSWNLFFLWRIRFHFFECIVPNPNPNLFIFWVHAVNSSIGMHVYFLTAHNKAILAHKDHGLNIISDFESDSFTFNLENAFKPSPFRF